jgi:hypothetical protein
MIRGRIISLAITILLSASVSRAQTGNPNPKNFRLLFDGAEAAGVAGFEIDFERAPDLAFSPRLVAARGSAPRLSLTLTPKGIAGISSWLNDAGNGAVVTPRSVDIQSLDTDGGVVLEWRLDGVQPVAITQLSAGTGGQTTVSVVFAFEKLTVVRASTN